MMKGRKGVWRVQGGPGLEPGESLTEHVRQLRARFAEQHAARGGVARLFELYAAGASFAAIGAHFGFSRQRAHQVVTALAFPARSWLLRAYSRQRELSRHQADRREALLRFFKQYGLTGRGMLGRLHRALQGREPLRVVVPTRGPRRLLLIQGHRCQVRARRSVRTPGRPARAPVFSFGRFPRPGTCDFLIAVALPLRRALIIPCDHGAARFLTLSGEAFNPTGRSRYAGLCEAWHLLGLPGAEEAEGRLAVPAA
ncbi:MAG: hypothetical protein HYV08_04660 [Deltaproteobacteria bacterium]|nr:hypothetical protein [Deltaproteobacteria bacterium]MBI3079470.1 hypothetical protein [Deltaproteobacteria bacterium]